MCDKRKKKRRMSLGIVFMSILILVSGFFIVFADEEPTPTETPTPTPTETPTPTPTETPTPTPTETPTPTPLPQQHGGSNSRTTRKVWRLIQNYQGLQKSVINGWTCFTGFDICFRILG